MARLVVLLAMILTSAAVADEPRENLHASISFEQAGIMLAGFAGVTFVDPITLSVMGWRDSDWVAPPINPKTTAPGPKASR